VDWRHTSGLWWFWLRAPSNPDDKVKPDAVSEKSFGINITTLLEKSEVLELLRWTKSSRCACHSSPSAWETAARSTTRPSFVKAIGFMRSNQADSVFFCKDRKIVPTNASPRTGQQAAQRKRIKFLRFREDYEIRAEEEPIMHDALSSITTDDAESGLHVNDSRKGYKGIFAVRVAYAMMDDETINCCAKTWQKKLACQPRPFRTCGPANRKT